MHPRLRHVPPKEPASMSATRRRSKSSGITTAPEPAPMTARSKFCTTRAYGRRPKADLRQNSTPSSTPDSLVLSRVRHKDHNSQHLRPRLIPALDVPIRGKQKQC